MSGDRVHIRTKHLAEKLVLIDQLYEQGKLSEYEYISLGLQVKIFELLVNTLKDDNLSLC